MGRNRAAPAKTTYSQYYKDNIKWTREPDTGAYLANVDSPLSGQCVLEVTRHAGQWAGRCWGFLAALHFERLNYGTPIEAKTDLNGWFTYMTAHAPKVAR